MISLSGPQSQRISLPCPNTRAFPSGEKLRQPTSLGACTYLRSPLAISQISIRLPPAAMADRLQSEDNTRNLTPAPLGKNRRTSEHSSPSAERSQTCWQKPTANKHDAKPKEACLIYAFMMPSRSARKLNADLS